MADSFAAVDVRRQPGWLPDDQEDLEAWLAGHRERVSAKNEQVVLHPVITEFEELINSDSVVRMYLNQMIAQVPQARQYRKRHLDSVQQMLRLINEVLTMAPEFSEDAMVMAAARRDPRLDDGDAGWIRCLPRPADQRDVEKDPDRVV